jgi:DNA-binding response OmpR family regulator
MESKRILLVEDNPDDAELIINGLRRNDFVNEIDVVYDGDQMLDYLLRRGAFADRATPDPALILLDLTTPRIDGHTILASMKSDARIKCLPVVVLTSSAQERDIAVGYDLGANAYVVRPIEVRELVEVVDQIGRFWLGINRPPR